MTRDVVYVKMTSPTLGTDDLLAPVDPGLEVPGRSSSLTIESHVVFRLYILRLCERRHRSPTLEHVKENDTLGRVVAESLDGILAFGRGVLGVRASAMVVSFTLHKVSREN